MVARPKIPRAIEIPVTSVEVCGNCNATHDESSSRLKCPKCKQEYCGLCAIKVPETRTEHLCPHCEVRLQYPSVPVPPKPTALIVLLHGQDLACRKCTEMGQLHLFLCPHCRKQYCQNCFIPQLKLRGAYHKCPHCRKLLLFPPKQDLPSR